MRALLVLTALCLALAGPAAGQEKSRFVIVQPQAKAEAGLRGPLSAPGPSSPRSPAAPQSPAAAPPNAPVGVTWRAPAGRPAARQCQAGCDRTYYFCLSADDGDSCPTGWSQCRAKCEPPLG